MDPFLALPGPKYGRPTLLPSNSLGVSGFDNGPAPMPTPELAPQGSSLCPSPLDLMGPWHPWTTPCPDSPPAGAEPGQGGWQEGPGWPV